MKKTAQNREKTMKKFQEYMQEREFTGYDRKISAGCEKVFPFYG